MQQLEKIQSESLGHIADLNDLKELEDTRVRLLGKSGEITGMLKSLGQLPAEERKSFGQAVNQVKAEVAQALEQKRTELEQKELNEKLATEAVDVTLPPRLEPQGKLHPISYVIEEVGEVLGRVGFEHATGPELETDFYNFTALNIPEDHPARQDHDTFYVQTRQGEEPKVLRTQTSNVQIHTMEKGEPPFRVMSIGRVYRCDSDVTHTPQFHQVEGLAIDKDLTFGHLKGVLKKFMEDFFERKVEMRLRPSYFPFVEPGAEVDIGCLFCGGKGCRVCKHTGWLEVLGSGMVHRNVLGHCKVDHNQWQGFAFGAGIERLAMLKYGVDDLRMFYESHISFLEHFGRPVSDLKAGG